VGKARRGGFIFVWWRADHAPRHVHVYRDGKLVVKWDLDSQRPMKGRAPRRVIELIAELVREGVL
jgi:hypothetical protein